MDLDRIFFSDVGKRIKAILRGIFYVESILTILAGVVVALAGLFNMMSGDPEFFALVLLAPLGVAVAIGVLWLSILPFYGIAEIVDTAIINRNEEKPTQAVAPILSPAPTPIVPTPPSAPAPTPAKDPRAFSVEDYWVCKVCTTKNQKDRTVCWCCDSAKDQPAIDVTAYLGKKWCSGCGNILEKEAASCSCGSKYLTVITAENAHRYVSLPQKSSIPTTCPVCDCKLIPFEIDGITMCPECGRTFG